MLFDKDFRICTKLHFVSSIFFPLLTLYRLPVLHPFYYNWINVKRRWLKIHWEIENEIKKEHRKGESNNWPNWWKVLKLRFLPHWIKNFNWSYQSVLTSLGKKEILIFYFWPNPNMLKQLTSSIFFIYFTQVYKAEIIFHLTNEKQSRNLLSDRKTRWDSVKPLPYPIFKKLFSSIFLVLQSIKVSIILLWELLFIFRQRFLKKPLVSTRPTHIRPIEF